MQAQVAVTSVFSFIYLVLSAVSVFVLVKRIPQAAVPAYATLLLTVAFQSISTIFLLFGTVVGADGLLSPDDPSYGPTNVALLAISNFFSYWAYALLFLTLCVLVRYRHLVVLQSSSSPSIIHIPWPTLYWSAFVLLIIFGIVTTALGIDYDRLVYGENNSYAQDAHSYQLEYDVHYTFYSIWYFVSACLIGYIIYVFVETRRQSVDDKVRLFA